MTKGNFTGLSRLEIHDLDYRPNTTPSAAAPNANTSTPLLRVPQVAKASVDVFMRANNITSNVGIMFCDPNEKKVYIGISPTNTTEWMKYGAAVADAEVASEEDLHPWGDNPPVGGELFGLSYLQFINKEGQIFVDADAVVQFYSRFSSSDVKGPTQICTVLTGGYPVGRATSSSGSALLELNSHTGALLVSRMNTVQKNTLYEPQPGMIVYDTTENAFSFYQYDQQHDKFGWTTDTLSPTGVIPGNYTSANITVDAYGRITSASDGGGVPGDGTVTSITLQKFNQSNTVPVDPGLNLVNNPADSPLGLNAITTSDTVYIKNSGVIPNVDPQSSAIEDFTYPVLTINSMGFVTNALNGSTEGTVKYVSAGTGLQGGTIGYKGGQWIASEGIFSLADQDPSVDGQFVYPSITVNSQGMIAQINSAQVYRFGFNGLVLLTSVGSWTAPVGIRACKITMVGQGGQGGSCNGEYPPNAYSAPGGSAGSTTINLFTNLPDGATFVFTSFTSSQSTWSTNDQKFTSGGVQMKPSYNSNVYVTPHGLAGFSPYDNDAQDYQLFTGPTSYLPSTGDINIAGGCGGGGSLSEGTDVSVPSGAGGSSFLGGGGAPTFPTQTANDEGIIGINAPGIGGGGSGAVAPSNDNQKAEVNFAGGHGGPWAVMIEY